MAPGAARGTGRAATRRRGNKPQAHKRRRGGAAPVLVNEKNSVRKNDFVGAKNGKKYRPRNRPRTGGDSTAANNSWTSARNRKGAPKNNSGLQLQPIRVSSSGIMSTWMKPLGGLIRYYVHLRTHDHHSPVDQHVAEEAIEKMYYRSGCNMEDTKAMILESLGVAKDIQNGWISMAMAIEKDGQLDNIPISDENNAEDLMDVSNINGESTSGYDQTANGKGIKLKQVLRAGEGPAHSHEQWMTIAVPDWAVSKSYFFEIENKSPLNLSCELYLDGEKVAFNAPLLPYATSTIRPDTVRYYQRHQWILNKAKKVKLATARNDTPNGDINGHHTPSTPRYNGLRPDYAGQRVSYQLYRDPTTFGWKFTGSVTESRVEFYEKKMNNGGVVKLDFYYTTGTIKTTLHHPTGGKNQLFRAQVSPRQYDDILMNPRAHTGQGYRRVENRPTDNHINNQEEEDDKFDRLPPVENHSVNEAETGDANASEMGANETYYARDDNYDFKTQGHQNRRDQMSKLQQSNGYAEWKAANTKEYAVIHAKFYVSIPQRMYGRSLPKKTTGGFKKRKGKQMDPLPLPEQSTVMDTKASENATLGTKYDATAPPQNIGRSFVRMERINGLKDDKDWKGNPVFETKLYYRAESVVKGEGFGVDSDVTSEDESGGNNEETNQTSLNEYKTEKIDQVKQYYSELNVFIPDPEEAEQRLRNVKNKIHLSESNTDVDDIVKLFYNDLTRREIVDSTNLNQ